VALFWGLAALALVAARLAGESGIESPVASRQSPVSDL
jgi:hypothetical protein